jgi:hypothetical protein
MPGTHDLEQLADQIAKVARGFAERAATAAAPKLSALAHAQWAAGEGADSDPWVPLKATGGVPLRSAAGQISVAALGKSIVFSGPDWLKYHQGGYRVHIPQDVMLQVALARTPKERREAKKEAKASGTRVPARAPFPKTNKAMPIAWGQCLQRAIEELLADELRGAG